jgi:hypothetical protein
MPPVPRADLPRVCRETVAGLSDDLSSESARNALRRYIDRIVIPAVGLRKAIGNPAAMGIELGGIVGCGGTQPSGFGVLVVGRLGEFPAVSGNCPNWLISLELAKPAVCQTEIRLPTIFGFSRKSFRLFSFSDRATWLLLALATPFWCAAGTIAGTVFPTEYPRIVG